MSKYETNESGGWIVPDRSSVAAGTIIPAHSKLGNECKLGYGCMLEGSIVKSWLTVANVDGTGRQILIIGRPDGAINIRAGCFYGTDAEFLARAASEGKTRYAAVIGAICAAMKAQEDKP